MCTAGTEGVKCRHELAHLQGGYGEALDGDTKLNHSSGKQNELEASGGGSSGSGGGSGDLIFSVYDPEYDPSFYLFFFFTPLGCC